MSSWRLDGTLVFLKMVWNFAASAGLESTPARGPGPRSGNSGVFRSSNSGGNSIEDMSANASPKLPRETFKIVGAPLRGAHSVKIWSTIREDGPIRAARAYGGFRGGVVRQWIVAN